MAAHDEFKVFVTNYVVHESKPYVFGVTDDGRTVGIRVIHFPFVLYIEPMFDKESESKSRQWFQQRVKPFLEKNQRLSKFYRPSCQLVNMKKLCSVSDSKASSAAEMGKTWIVKATYDTMTDLKRDASDVVYKIRTCKVFHDRLDPNLVFTAATGIRCFTWVTCRMPSFVESHKITRCDVEIMVDVKRVVPSYTDDDPDNIPPFLRIATFDIETDGLNWDNDELRMISINCDGKDFLLTRHPLDVTDPPNYILVECFDERDLIRKFVDVVHNLKPVFLTGWNIFRFDIRFVYERAKLLGIFTDIEKLSWLSVKKLNPVEKEMTSNAFGQNKIYHDDLEGLITLDGYILARKGMKMSSYSLKAFGEWIGDHKGDVSYQDMVEAFSSKNPGKLREVADYCVQDSRLVPKILARMEEPDKVMAMTRLAAVPPVYAIKRGQSILTFGLILGEAFKRNLVVNPPPKPKDQEQGYKGATVVDPIRGYHKDPVAVLDFESLYPSIMRAYNICISTFVGTFPEKPAAYEWPAYSVIEIESGEFVVFRKEGEEGVFPSILRILLERRKAVKNSLRTLEEGSVAYNQANAKQLSLKIAANSMYGYLGAATSQIYEKALAASVTSMGRQSLWKVRGIVDTLRTDGKIPKDVHVVYGDSVTGDTPLIVKKQGRVMVTTVEELQGNWEPFGEGKEAFVPLGGIWEVWQDGGFTTILRVIRHRVTKPLVRVITRRGLVDCTLDHSLLKPDGSKVSPMNVGVGTDLLHSSMDFFVKTLRESSKINPEEAFEMGVYGMLDDDLLEASKETVSMFWEGFDPEQGYHTKKVAAFLCIIGKKLGLSYRFECYDEASNLVALVPDDDDGFQEKIVEKWLIPLPGNTSVMVYDLETASHHFGVGPGALVVHNTDSVLIKFPGCAPEKAHEWATFIEDECTKAFVAPMRLEYENLFVTFLLEQKKKYAGRVWNPTPGAPPSTVIKGLCVKRRDFPRIIQKGLSGILDILLEGGDDAPQRALHFVEGILQNILQNKVPPEELSITKELNKSSYKTPPPHLIVSQKMAKRNPEDPPKPGDRITFVVLHGKGNISDRVEEFEYVVQKLEGSVKYDSLYYADQLASQCKNMMKLCGQAREFDEILVKTKLKSQGQSRLTAFFRARTDDDGENDLNATASKRPSSENDENEKPVAKKQSSMLKYLM